MLYFGGDRHDAVLVCAHKRDRLVERLEESAQHVRVFRNQIIAGDDDVSMEVFDVITEFQKEPPFSLALQLERRRKIDRETVDIARHQIRQTGIARGNPYDSIDAPALLSGELAHEPARQRTDLRDRDPLAF